MSTRPDRQSSKGGGESRPPAPIYGPVPVRAFGDPALEGADFRVLGIIAAHDRLNANGSGCYAGHKRLAAKVGIHFVTFSKSTTKLGKLGYLTAEPHPLNRKLRVYRVLYTAADRELMAARDDGTVSPQANDCPVDGGERNGGRNGERNGEGRIVSLQANSPAPIASLENRQATENATDSSVNIFCEAENTFPRREEIYTPEGAPPNGDAALENGNETAVGAFLAMSQRRLTNGQVEDSELPGLHEKLEAIAASAEHDDPCGNWAQRVGEMALERMGFYNDVPFADG